MGSEFTKLAKKMEQSVVNITADYMPKQEQARSGRHPQQDQDEDGDDNGNGNGMDLFKKFFGRGGGEQDGPPMKREQSGTGFLVDKNGYIITNQHVVSSDTQGNPVDHIFVKLHGDSTEYRARLIGSDKESDIAVIKIDSKRPVIPVVIGNSDGVQVGDWAVAIGSPFGLEATVTAGIVSATGRDVPGNDKQFQHFIQTDAAINPGNSGGPLLNIQGEVIGVNTMIATQSGGYQGIGFALPINMVARVYNDIIKEGRVMRGSIGVSWETRDPNPQVTLKALGLDHGQIVGVVKKGGPADKAGIKEQDIMLGLNGQPIKDGQDLIARVSDMPIGSQVTVGVDRDGKKMEFKVAVADRMEVWSEDRRVGGIPKPEAEETAKLDTSAHAAPGEIKFGIYPRQVSEEERALTPDKHGVTVTRVEPGSFADEIGMQEHDIIIAVNRQPVSSVDDIKKVQQTLKPGDAVAFRVVRSIRGQRGRAMSTESETLYVSGTLPEN
jgi:serine protease Do